VPDEELQKVKNQFAAAQYRKLSSNFPILMQLIMNVGLGDWREVNAAGPNYQAVTKEDIQRVATKYFSPENRIVGTYSRKEGAAPKDDPDLAGLTPEQKPVVRNFIGMLNQESDASKLKAMLQQMEGATSNPDPKRRQFQNLLKKKVEARLAELEKK
jgi:hypothetical protein